MERSTPFSTSPRSSERPSAQSICLSAATLCIPSTEGVKLLRAIMAQDAWPDDAWDSVNPRPLLPVFELRHKGKRYGQIVSKTQGCTECRWHRKEPLLLNIISIPRTKELACHQTPPAVSPGLGAFSSSRSPIGSGYNPSRSRNRRGTSFASRTSITSQPARRALSIPGPESSSAMA